MRSSLDARIMSLVSTTLHDAGRAVGLVWFRFGKKPEGQSHISAMDSGEVRLHVQCAWRMTHRKRIVVASTDRFYPRGDPHQEDDNFDWTVPYSTRCDERLATMVSEDRSSLLEVLLVTHDEYGGLNIIMADDWKLTIFPDDSLGEEYWRLFTDHPEEDHVVMSGEGLSWA